MEASGRDPTSVGGPPETAGRTHTFLSRALIAKTGERAKKLSRAPANASANSAAPSFLTRGYRLRERFAGSCGSAPGGSDKTHLKGRPSAPKSAIQTLSSNWSTMRRRQSCTLCCGSADGQALGDALLEVVFTELERCAMVANGTPFLTSSDKIAGSRVGQARYLLEALEAACDVKDSAARAEAELKAVRDSFVNQPMYFTQDFKAHFKRGSAKQAAGSVQRCHNLDFATSGVLVLAKTEAGLRAAAGAFDPGQPKWGSVTKEYSAVILGWPDFDSQVLEQCIVADPESAFKMRAVSSEESVEKVTDDIGGKHREKNGVPRNILSLEVASRWGPSRMPPAPRWDRDRRSQKPRPALTHVEVIRRGRLSLEGPLKGRKVSLVKLSPNTGRRHQLRVHLANIGHPILGDVTYAGDIWTHRLCLHARAVAFLWKPVDVPVSSGEKVEGEPAWQHVDRSANEGGLELREVLPPHGMHITTAEDPFELFVVTDGITPKL
ncbi:hypothetical protein CYMTET_8479 [Cymbomonas tetramitiformis]|uniref:Pseudouridine synthase RsuA/RluA-like domain-containing protein n=1 Tax=Cymbomonas tetramitiformis TaxID=36881 RepID=A0AAE0GTE4_9CHLO|nr:hypothetical protein CYMTET_8479 [Cymbomonas tetramitiformis]